MKNFSCGGAELIGPPNVSESVAEPASICKIFGITTFGQTIIHSFHLILKKLRPLNQSYNFRLVLRTFSYHFPSQMVGT